MITLGDVVELLHAKVLWGEDALQKPISRAFAGDMMSDVLASSEGGDILLTNLVGSQVIRTAEMTELSGIILVSNKKLNQSTINLAKDLNIPLAKTNLPLFTCCGLLYAKGVRGRGDI